MSESAATHRMVKMLAHAEHVSVDMMVVRADWSKEGQSRKPVYTGPHPVLMYTRMLFGNPDVDAVPAVLECITSEN
jgi:hypothetical protein